MKKIISLTLIGLASFSIHAQTFKDKFFQQIGFSVYTDVYFTPLKDESYTATVDDKNGNPIEMKLDGYSRGFDLGAATFYYSPRLNIIEIGTENSFSINMPLGVHLSIGSRGFDADYVLPGTSFKKDYGYSIESLGSLSFPIYFTYNTGMGATLSSEKEKGFSVGLGLDNRLFGIQLTDNKTTNGPALSNFSTLPSVMFGFKYWRNDKAKELKIKFSYWPPNIAKGNTEINYFQNSGLAFALTFNKFLNF